MLRPKGNRNTIVSFCILAIICATINTQENLQHWSKRERWASGTSRGTFSPQEECTVPDCGRLRELGWVPAVTAKSRKLKAHLGHPAAEGGNRTEVTSVGSLDRKDALTSSIWQKCSNEASFGKYNLRIILLWFLNLLHSTLLNVSRRIV